MNPNASAEIYALRPTPCAPNPKVIKHIAKRIAENLIASGQELPIACRMGLVATTPVAPRIRLNEVAGSAQFIPADHGQPQEVHRVARNA